MKQLLTLLKPCRLLRWAIFVLLQGSPLAASAAHDAAFWKAIPQHNFAVPTHESVGNLALEIADLAAETDPALRDDCGYQILAAWVYRQNLLTGGQLEALRRKLLPAMIVHIGESETDTVFRRSFSALYMSILAAQDLRQPFLSAAAFHETLETALRCYGDEKDFRGYVSEKGWAHATAHVADLLKFLARNAKLSVQDQKRIVASVSQRCRTATSVFTWGEDARIAAALLSLVDRKDFDASNFDGWFNGLVAENKELWNRQNIDIAMYVSVRAQANVLAHLAAKIDRQKDNNVSESFRNALNAALVQVD